MKANLRDSRRESQTSLSDPRSDPTATFLAGFTEEIAWPREKSPCANSIRSAQYADGTLAVLPVFTLLHSDVNSESMSQTQPPDNELARLRATVEDYEKK